MIRRISIAVLGLFLALLPACASKSGGAESSSHPLGGKGSPPLNFAVLGDFGEGGSAEDEVARAMCEWRRRHHFNLVVTVGDNIYPDGSPSLFRSEFFDPFACLLDHGVTFHAALGNHDVETDGGKPEIDDPRFGMPAANYVVRTHGVRFVFLNSNDLDVDWLKANIGPEKGDRWTVVVFHHPVYSPGTEHGSTPGFRPLLPKLFAEHGVDLVLNGHDHIYSVSKELNGIRYVVEGGGGADLYGCVPESFTDVCKAEHGFLFVQAGKESIDASAVTQDQIVFDRFSTTGRN